MRALRTLAAAFALTALLAACSDALSPTTEGDVAPRQGRMLSPGQASQVKPGDFIIYRPEEYAKYGIATFTTASGGQALRSWGSCGYTQSGFPCCDGSGYNFGYGESCCYDPWGNPTYDIGCDPQPPACYDSYGNLVECCYDAYGNVTSCPEPPTCYDADGNVVQCCYDADGNVTPCPPPTQVQLDYGSLAPYDGQVNSGGMLLKQVRLISYSQAIANVASFSVYAAFKLGSATSSAGCNNPAWMFDYDSAYASGNGYLEVSRVAQWRGEYKWQVDGTHTYSPVSGATGGGTFYSTASFCG